MTMPHVPHGQECKELLSNKDAALPVRPNSAEHPLSGWAVNAFMRAGIHTVGELAERSADELLSLPNFGADSLRRTEAFLAQRGLELSEVSSDGPALNTTPGLYTFSVHIDPDVEERLRSAGLWEGPVPGSLVPGTKLRDLLGLLLRTPALADAGELDALLTTLGARGMLPRPASMNDFLALLAASEGARRTIEAVRWRFSGGTLKGAQEEAEAFDATGRLLDTVEAEISRGTLHEKALLDWRPLLAANAGLTPQERTLPALLAALLRIPEGGLYAETAVSAEEALSTYRTLDDELRMLLKDVLALDSRERLVMLGSFSRGRRLKLRELGERFGVSRERIRQVKVHLARRLERAYAELPLPRFRTAAQIAAELEQAYHLRHASRKCPVEVSASEVHAELEGRAIARSVEATRHALAARAAISYARGLEESQ